MNRLLLALIPALTWAADADSDAGADAAPNLGGVSALAESAIREVAREANEAGLAATQRKDFPAALVQFRRAYAASPDDPEITNNYAYLQFLLGNHVEAKRLYRLTLRLDARRRVAYVNLVELLMRRDATREELAEAETVLQRARDQLGNDPEVVLNQARLAARRGQVRVAERLYRQRIALKKGDDALFLEVGDFHRDRGRPEAALEFYRRVKGKGARLQTAALRIREIDIERAARRYGFTPGTREVPEQAVTLREQARAALRAGQVEDAARMLTEAVALAPLYAAAHADLGEVHVAADRGESAELSYLRALALDSGDADVLSRLAKLYSRQQRPAEAARCLERALQARPDRRHLQLRLARAYRASGDVPRALARVDRYLAEQPEDSPAEAARALRRALQRDPKAQVRVAEAPEAQGERLARAAALWQRKEYAAALAELDAIPEAEVDARVLKVRGSFMYRAGRWEEAAAAFTASLVRDGEQADVLELLADTRQRQGLSDQARALWARVERVGGHEAKLALAKLDLPAARGWLDDGLQLESLRAARGRLQAYLAGEATQRAAAEQLLASVDGRLKAVYGAGAASAGALVLLLGLGAARLWGGTELGALVRRHPEAGPEVQRVLSAIRHEVLKHNTMVLTGLVDALEAGEAVGEKATWCRRSLLGGADAGREEAAVERLRGYAARLMQVGRAQGARLNLERKDPALSALLRGFRVLEGAAPLLDRADELSARGRARLLRALRQATRLLNVEGYEAVRALLDQLRMLDVDEALLKTVYARVTHEPAFSGVRFAKLELELQAALPCRVAVPRHAFEDVLGNLVRNAVQSTVRHTGGAVHIGLGVHEEVDAITGLERLVFLIRDCSPQQLTPEMLRGRYIEAGLGLTADLVSRYEGTLDVRTEEAPWTKAVVVKLPRFDEGEDDPWQS